MESLSFYSYAISTLAYCLLLGLSLISIKHKKLAYSLAFCVFLSIVWSAYTLYIVQNEQFYIQDSFPAESLRNLGWFYFLSVLISKQQFDDPFYLFKHSRKIFFIFLVTIIVVVLELFSEFRYLLHQLIGFDFRLIMHVSFAIVGLMMVEQLYRNAVQEQRWQIKFLCLGLASIFLIDFILYSKSLLFSSIDTSLWDSRGFINALIVPLLGVSINRLDNENVKVKVSNKLILHSTVLLGSGGYLLLMSLAGYYIREYSGSWGAIAQVGFIFLAIILLLIFFVSGKIRALAKIYFSKNFFQHRYDYRDEWLKLSKMIAELDSLDDLSSFIVNTMANFVDGTGRGMWIKNDLNDYYLASEFNLGNHNKHIISKDDPLINFLINKQWVIDFVEYFNDPDIYAGAGLDLWHTELEEIWLIIPLFQKNSLEAIVVLTQPRVSRQIDWEDHDLLKTVGMQLANALALTKTTDDLSRSRQFEAYNRFSAFLVHDLKNLVAQVSLIVKNSEKHKRNPEFIDDSIETLENVVKKIDHILTQLKKGNIQSKKQSKLNLIEILHDVVLQQSSNKPAVEFRIEHNEQQYTVLGEKETMTAIIGHLVQNAQEATDDEGQVLLEINKNNDEIILKIIDTGSGMDMKFIQQRLFKPFDTTKGNAGMGVGVYEAREYILQQSGTISVKSILDKGTIFTINLPIANSL